MQADKTCKGHCFVKSRHIKQSELHFSAFDKTSENFALVSTERDKFAIEIPVARLYLPQQLAFGVFTISQQPARSNVVGQNGKQQGILAVVLEHHQTLHQVYTEHRVRLSFRHCCREPLFGQMPMSVTYIGIILPGM